MPMEKRLTIERISRQIRISERPFIIKSSLTFIAVIMKRYLHCSIGFDVSTGFDVFTFETSIALTHLT